MGSIRKVAIFRSVSSRTMSAADQRSWRSATKQIQRSWRGSQWWAQGPQEGCRARTQYADPQQGRQSRPRGDLLWVAREWTAVAGDRRRMGRQGENVPDKLDWWRLGRRGANTSCSQTWARGTWNPGHAARPGSWREPWPVSDAGMWPATAVADPDPSSVLRNLPSDKMS